MFSGLRELTGVTPMDAPRAGSLTPPKGARTNGDELYGDPLGGVATPLPGGGVDAAVAALRESTVVVPKMLSKATNPLLLPGVKLSKSSLRYWTKKLNIEHRKKLRLEKQREKRADALKALKEGRRTRPRHLHYTQKLKRRRVDDLKVMEEKMYYRTPEGRYKRMTRNARVRGLEFMSREEWGAILEIVGEDMLYLDRVMIRRVDPTIGFTCSNISIVHNNTTLYP